MHKKHFFIPLFLLLVLYIIFLLKPIYLTSSDLGRHIANGRELIQGNKQVLFTNEYSYTHPNQKFINHHWLTGVIFYLSEKMVGFSGLHILHTLLLLAMLSIFYKNISIGGNKSPYISFFVGTFAILFLSSRSEIRPESFGYLSISLVLLFLTSLEQKIKLNQPKNIENISWKTIALLILLQLFWVNLHISFIFGIFLVGLFLTVNIAAKKLFSKQPFVQILLNKDTTKKLSFLLLGQIVISLFNPNHIKGLLAPFALFTNYGYSVVENQTMMFLRYFLSGPIIYLYFSTATTIIILLILFWKKTTPFTIAITIVGTILGYTALRNMPIFVLFSFPFIATALFEIKKIFKDKITIDVPRFYFPVLSLCFYLFIIFLILSGNYKPNISAKTLSIGLAENQLMAAKFFKENNLNGPIFNNYDLGSYLVYSLPNEKVFVDNRPEAYTVNFFQKEYIPMQENELIWQEQLKKHDFNTIFFGHHDATPWGRSFFAMRLGDPEWDVIYQDDFSVIFERNRNIKLLD